MFAYKAVITAGAKHEKWQPGVQLSSVFFVKASKEEEAFDIACQELSDRGYRSVDVKSFKEGVTMNGGEANDPIFLAYQEAQEAGFSLVVFPENT